jgi:hypothetical protein
MYEKEKGDSRHPHRLELIHVALVYSIKSHQPNWANLIAVLGSASQFSVTYRQVMLVQAARVAKSPGGLMLSITAFATTWPIKNHAKFQESRSVASACRCDKESFCIPFR